MSSQQQNALLEKSVQSVRPNSKPFGRTPDIAMHGANGRQQSDGSGQNKTPLIEGKTFRNESDELVTAKRCAVCRESFTAKKPHGRYCSTRCRMKAYRARKRDGGAGLAMLLAFLIPLLMLACGELGAMPLAQENNLLAVSAESTPDIDQLQAAAVAAVAAVETVEPEQPVNFIGLPENQDVVRTEIASIDAQGGILWRTLFRCGDRWEVSYEAITAVSQDVYDRYIASVHSWYDSTAKTMHSAAVYRLHAVAFDCQPTGQGGA